MWGAVLDRSGGAEEGALFSTTPGPAAVNGVATFHFSVEFLPPFEFSFSIPTINRK